MPDKQLQHKSAIRRLPVAGIAAAGVAGGLLGDGRSDAAFGHGTPALGVGPLMVAIGPLEAANAELEVARTELPASCARTRRQRAASSIRRAVRAEPVVDPGLPAAALSAGANPLTAREREGLAAAREHAPVAQLAAALHLSHGTARNHLSAVMCKVGAANPLRAIRIAERNGGV